MMMTVGRMKLSGGWSSQTEGCPGEALGLVFYISRAHRLD